MRTPTETELHCTHIADALERRWDGELTPLDSEALDRHLAQCTACAARAAADARLRITLRSADRSTRVLPSGAEWSRRVAAQERGFQQGRRALGLGGLSLAAAAVAVGVYLQRPIHGTAPIPASGKVVKAAAPAPPALFVIDDEESGRQVFQSAPRTE